MIENMYYWFGILALALLTILIIREVVSGQMNHETENNPNVNTGNYIYWDYESEPDCWPHNDSLFAIIVYRTDDNDLPKDLNTDEGWKLANIVLSEPAGACLECEETIEKRKNGIVFHYEFCWKRQFVWLLQFDFVRMLFDSKYYEETLSDAQRGDADAQALIGCCYGHVGKQATSVVQHNEEKAVEWWQKAASQNHKYAMRELAIYYWHKKEYEKARDLNKKGNLNIFIMSNGA